MRKEKIYKGKSFSGGVILPGDPKGLPDDFLRVVVFIDNAYLIRLKNHFFRNSFRYSLEKFVRVLAKKSNLFVEKIFLYDAPPFQSRESNKRENKMRENYDRFVLLFRKEGIVVREGRTQRIRVGDAFVYRQKGVDMLLGIDMVTIQKDYPDLNGVVLLSGDSDFVPVVLRVRFLGMNVILWTYFERNRESPFSRSNYLVESVDKFIKIERQDFLEVGNG